MTFEVKMNGKIFSLIFATLILSVIFLSYGQIGAAHRFHSSLTRIDYNSEQKNVEITIRLFTHDLKEVLEKRGKQPIDLEKTSDIDKKIFDYLSQHFTLTDAKGESKAIKWVGKELENDSALIYLEVNSTNSIENFSLKNTIFLDDFPEQANIVVCRFDGKKSDLLFKAGEKVKLIAANKTAEK